MFNGEGVPSVKHHAGKGSDFKHFPDLTARLNLRSWSRTFTMQVLTLAELLNTYPVLFLMQCTSSVCHIHLIWNTLIIHTTFLYIAYWILFFEGSDVSVCSDKRVSYTHSTKGNKRDLLLHSSSCHVPKQVWSKCITTLTTVFLWIDTALK